MKINGIQIEMPKINMPEPAESIKPKGANFANVISEAINEVNNQVVESDNMIENLLTGKSRNVHETMVAVEKADISMKLMMSIRNKALEAYNTVMRMQA